VIFDISYRYSEELPANPDSVFADNNDVQTGKNCVASRALAVFPGELEGGLEWNTASQHSMLFCIFELSERRKIPIGWRAALIDRSNINQ
jgi:hypothetical protein